MNIYITKESCAAIQHIFCKIIKLITKINLEKNPSWVWWYMPVIPATQEAEARR
jgi:hypothetical protein